MTLLDFEKPIAELEAKRFGEQGHSDTGRENRRTQERNF